MIPELNLYLFSGKHKRRHIACQANIEMSLQLFSSRTACWWWGIGSGSEGAIPRSFIIFWIFKYGKLVIYSLHFFLEKQETNHL
jgi:hypothetical protein